MDKKDSQKIKDLYQKLKKTNGTFIGYPCNGAFNYSDLYKFLEFPINNVGDPFEESTYHLQTKKFERDVIKFFANLFHLKDYWGYVTNGGTEGNLYGLYLGRETLPDATVLFSDQTHYSVKKNVHILKMKNQIIKSQQNGEIDYKDFENKVKNKKSVIVIANIGSTMTGAIDDIQKITKILKKHKIKYYIHADAAFYGMILPFISNIIFDFRTEITSISVSGHKFIGSPIPCGIVLTRKKSMLVLKNYIEYVGSHDTTITGSRNAFTPLVIWHQIKNQGIAGFKKRAQYSNELATFLFNELVKIGWPDVARSYVTIKFKRPSEKIIHKWQLATDKNTSHVICLPSQTKKQLRQFIQELKNEL